MIEQFQYRQANANDRDIILQFLLTHFIKAEPCTVAMGLKPDEMESIYADIVDRCLAETFSTIVFAKSGDVAAVLLNSIWKRTDDLSEVDLEGDDKSEQIQLFVKMLNKSHEDFWKHAPSHIQAVLHREISCVGTPYQRKGIATRLVTENMTFSKLMEYNIGGIISETTSFANQNLLAKHGFKCLKVVPYSDVINSKGERVFETADGSNGVRLNFKPIQDFTNLKI